jgi:pyridoxal phosphate enzyme (YggS family)
MSIIENIQRVQREIALACQRALRNPEEIELVAVSKGVPAAAVRQAVEAGVRKIGENRVQEAEGKIESLGGICEWHMIGHLQTNKVRKALGLFDVFQSIDSLRIAEEIHRRAEELDRTVPVLVEVNTSDEPTKYGFSPKESLPALQAICRLGRLDVRGLMTIGAWTEDEAVVRGCFRTLRELSVAIERELGNEVSMDVLSMGMTDDFEIAIEEGSTMVRIGRAIFGERSG